MSWFMRTFFSNTQASSDVAQTASGESRGEAQRDDYEQLSAALESGECPVEDVEQFLNSSVYDPKEILRRKKYQLLESCIRHGNTKLLDKFLPKYFSIILHEMVEPADLYSENHDLAYANFLKETRHTELLLTAIKNNHPTTLIRLLQNATLKPEPSYQTWVELSDGDPFYIHRYGRSKVSYVKDTIKKYFEENRNETTPLYESIFKIESDGYINKFCNCTRDVHEFKCMYNRIDSCKLCWSRLMQSVLNPETYGPVNHLDYSFQQHGHVKPKDCIGIKAGTLIEQVELLLRTIEADKIAYQEYHDEIKKNTRDYDTYQQPGVVYYSI